MTTLKKGIPLVAAAITLASASPALADSGEKCAESQAYGSTCIAITGHGLTVKDVQGYFTPPNNDYLSHRRWGLELTSYRCDPRGQTPRQCRARHRWFTRVRRGNPPHEGSMCAIFTPGGIGFQQCQDYGIAYADAQFGDWRGFYRMKHRFHHATWLCTGLVVRKHGHWRRNGPAADPGDRGCAEVHA
jgi:hypothetical protein